MLEDGNNGALLGAQLSPSRLRCGDDEYFYFDEATFFHEADAFATNVVDLDDGDPKLNELLELTGALDIAHGGWLCHVAEDGALEKVVARVGVAPFGEIARVIGSVRGLINLTNASQPFQWLSGGREYIVCAIGDRSIGRVVLFLRARMVQNADWSTVKDAANRIQRLIYVALSMGRPMAQIAGAQEPGTFPAQALIDLCPFGIMVIDLDQRIHLANGAAKAQLESEAISCAADRLAIFNADDAVRFQVALRAVLMAPPEKSVQQTLALVDGQSRPLLLQIARVPGVRAHAHACIMITDPGAGREINIQPLAQVFALTPVETRLVSQLVQGRNVQEAARALHLKVETVRTYLKQVFQKTGTHRQVELVQLMQNGALPALSAG